MPPNDHASSDAESHRRDVFISHAGPDKDTIVRPFVEQLIQRDISYWLDEAELAWGQSLLQTISDGLEDSRFVLVFITETFLTRPWPEAELRAALSREISSNVVRVLPVLAFDSEKVFSRYPFLRDKKWLSWDRGPSSIVAELEQLLGRSFQAVWKFSHPAWFRGDVWLRILPRLENVGKRHQYQISWGRWNYQGEHTFKTPDAIILSFKKIAEKDSYPIYFEISPPAFTASGLGAPIVDVNKGWCLVDNSGYGKALLTKWIQFLRRDSEP